MIMQIARPLVTLDAQLESADSVFLRAGVPLGPFSPVVAGKCVKFGSITAKALK
jgi:hypothetical protein